jgi:hypothetical protein
MTIGSDMEKREIERKHSTDEVASDTHAANLRKFLYPRKKLNVKHRKILLDLLEELEVGHPLSRVIEFPQFYEARKQLAKLARKYKHIS